MNLDHAFHCFPGDPVWSAGSRLVVQEIGNQAVATEDPQLQSRIYRCLVTCAYPAVVEQTVTTRIRNIFRPFQVTADTLEISSAFKILASTRMHDAMRVLKTWVNSWATSHRSHESVQHRCLFGCDDARDSMNHYVMCPILFAITRQLVPATPACPLKRIGLIDPSKESILCVACAFSGYHAVKRACSELSIKDGTLTFGQRFAAHTIFCDFFWTEALDNGLRCKHFRPDFGSSSALIWEQNASFNSGVAGRPAV